MPNASMRTASFPGLARLSTRTAALLALLLIMSLAVGCDDAEPDAEEAEATENQDPAQVDLPSAPPASAFDIPEKNDDGTLRVEGLIQYQDKHLGKEVKVTGFISEVLGDCDPNKAKKRDEPCPKPHYIITDEEGDEKELMVVGFDREYFEKAGVEQGETHVFEGTYKKIAQQFVNSENGLLLLDRIGDAEAVETAEK
ncbi:MAG: hypothetical protein ACLFVJ_09805 [Persicimonas sp.]